MTPQLGMPYNFLPPAPIVRDDTGNFPYIVHLTLQYSLAQAI